MEKIKKKMKLYFPYKLFDIEGRSKSQISLFKRPDIAPISSPMGNNNKKYGVNNYSKKLKSTILSSKIFSQYMNNYVRLTQDFCFKSPTNTSYPLKKNYHLLPLRERRNLAFDENKTNVDNNINSVIEKPYGYKYKKTKIVINNTKELHRSASEKIRAKIFLNFSEGQHYHKILMKTFGLKNIDINNCKNVIKDNYDYLQQCLKDLISIENFESEKDFEYKIRNRYKNEDSIFNMKIYSICFNFYEITEKKEKNINRKLSKKKLFLPFKLLPLFYLLNFSDFKNFLSEILYYNIQNDSMEISHYVLKEILKKYVQYIKKIFSKKDNKYINNISFYKNEFLFQSNYDWIVCDEDKSVKRPRYKLKISFPKVVFEKKSDKIKIVHHLNKNVFLQVIKKNFVNWEKLILFDLFSNKKFRYMINNILIGGDKYENCTIKLFENMINEIIIEKNKVSNNNEYEFFITEANKRESYYYIFTPNIILILSGSGEQKKLFQKVQINLNDSKKLYEISKYWGFINTLFRCMYKDESTNKIYFKMNILNNFPKILYKTIQKNIIIKNPPISKDINNNNSKENFLEYKTNDIELLISECLLKEINITKKERTYLYYKVPKELFDTIISTNDNIKIINSIQKNFNEIINNENEIDILKEEEKMIEKATKPDDSFEKYKLNKKPTIKALKSTPIKIFNKMKTLSTQIKPDNNIINKEFTKSFGKKNSILRKNKNTNKDEDKRKNVKISKFLNTKNSMVEINENLEKINDYNEDRFQRILNKNKNKKEDVKDNYNINDSKTFQNYKLGEKYIIDLRKKNSK